MKIVQSIDDIPPVPEPCGLTIGTFDGVHLGHQALLKHLRARVSDAGTVAVLTFSNHPSTFFSHPHPVTLLCSLEQRLSLLEKAGVDLVILLEFNQAFAEQPYDLFLRKLKKSLPFTSLVLGEGATLGKERKGDETHVKELGKEIGFIADYLPKTLAISSGLIRNLVATGDFEKASQLLGRPYFPEGK